MKPYKLKLFRKLMEDFSTVFIIIVRKYRFWDTPLIAIIDFNKDLESIETSDYGT